MRLTMVLNLKFPRGNMWIGKYRLVPPMGEGVRSSALKRLTWEYECMKLLSKPYLTEAQEACQPDWDAALANREKYQRIKLDMFGFDHVKMDDHLKHLNNEKKWE
ncbi:ribosomal protein 63, mitochondrial-like [Paramacrobiotus metropolitanus]|uniref:ribosomal protein 63, mitochondrial-like n=1 Tax=Paramacrobiotus metropolitanus TaxID=2943436 RepID=UPI0024462F57|nr:ribosomal protein 63, mitochondrial-like [Paramacrobiotus metropolitanus]